MSKHTPGPWHPASDEPWCGTEPTGIFSGTWDAKKGWQNSDQVWPPYCCDPASDKHARHVADLRLMAAAPELLEALTALLDACEHWENQNDPVLRSARAAIAKAEGR